MGPWVPPLAGCPPTSKAGGVLTGLTCSSSTLSSRGQIESRKVGLCAFRYVGTTAKKLKTTPACIRSSIGRSLDTRMQRHSSHSVEFCAARAAG